MKTKKLACIFIAAITALVIIIGALYMSGAKDSTKTIVTTNSNESVEKVALVDTSSSYVDTQVAINGIDAKIPFSTALYSESEYTMILKSLIQALDIGGFKEFYILTDLESDPEDKDFQTAKECEKKYSNVYVEFIIPDSVTESQISKYKGALADLLDISTTTLKFSKNSGEEIVCWDNYVVPEKDPLHVTVESNGNIPTEFVVFAMLLLFVIGMGLIIALILANCRENENNNTNTITVNTGAVPETTPIKAATTKPMMLDASNSVEKTYKAFINHVSAASAVDIFVFNSDVKKVTLAEAEAIIPNGGTRGWEALKMMFDNGYKEITILSDMEFNDDEDEAEAMKSRFDKIYFVLPKKGVNHEVLNKVKALANSYEEITL